MVEHWRGGLWHLPVVAVVMWCVHYTHPKDPLRLRPKEKKTKAKNNQCGEYKK